VIISLMCWFWLLSANFSAGGMAAFTLQIFHRLEKKVSKGKKNLPCFWLPESRESHTEQHELQASYGTSNHPYVSYVSLWELCKASVVYVM